MLAVQSSTLAPCVPSACTSASGQSSLVNCSSFLPTPSAAMTCGYDRYITGDCSGAVDTRSRVALGVCIANPNGGSVKYLDCSTGGVPTSTSTYSDSNCQFLTSGSSAAPTQSPGRVCNGGSCLVQSPSNSFKFLCNAVINVNPSSGCYKSSDINGDLKVNLQDLVLVLNAWGTCGTSLRCLQADLNCDGVVNISDLSTVLASWT